ncbi:universal stress protein [Tautonia sociabilis]|uniref:Universal stress protein n=1 Tax=Tautonia sociabilis TaxID=2080755 RepID=A0A432MPQ7_9BACT|nr:universal stress protein [Tautonia sociabilis]RUL89320.1 universal stress protein [Tautonia sociabilis]
MLKTMLVGLDGSVDGDAALELAIRWASRLDAMVVGLGIVDEPGIHGAEETWLGEVYFRQINERLTEDVRRAVDRTLERAAIRCAEAKVAFKPLEDVGNPSERILVEAQRYDLILMGQRTHFRFGWEDAADDTLRRVLTENPRPVVACPRRPGPESRNVLIAFDGSVQAARALQAFQASGIGQDRQISVLCCGTDKVEAARTADRASEYLGFHGLAAKPIVLKSDRAPAREILGQLEETKAELLVMGAYGKPTLREWILGSTTRAVLKECPVPVFLFH